MIKFPLNQILNVNYHHMIFDDWMKKMKRKKTLPLPPTLSVSFHLIFFLYTDIRIINKHDDSLREING